MAMNKTLCEIMNKKEAWKIDMCETCTMRKKRYSDDWCVYVREEKGKTHGRKNV